MRHRLGLRFTALASIAALGLAGCSSEPEDNRETLIISAVPAEEGADLKATYQPLMDMLEDELDMKIVFKPSASYADAIKAQTAGDIHIVQYGPLTYYQAMQSGTELTLLGAMKKKDAIEAGYLSYGFTNAESNINGIEDFKDKTVCFVDVNSTSGYLYPLKGLKDAGLVEGDWKQVETGSHDASVVSVVNGSCDAGFALDSMVDETLVNKGVITNDEIKVVWKSESIPEAPITVTNTLDRDIREQLIAIFRDKANQDYLVEHDYCNEDACDLTDQRVWGWTPVNSDHYQSVIDVCDAMQVESCQLDE